MAVCLHPRYISNPQKKENYLLGLDMVKRLGADCQYLSPYYRDNLVVPCGKCINCLKNKQNAMVSRVISEAKERHSFHFVTLTYDEDSLPLAESVYRCDVSTGECEHVGLEKVDCNGVPFIDIRPRIVHGHRICDLALSNRMRSIAPGGSPRYIDFPLFEGREIEGYTYFSRVTPSLNREDVRLWIKACRVAFKRETGSKLDFTYICVGEYGPRTCRPHYHLAFFGLSDEEVSWMVDRWLYGSQKSWKRVKAVNDDKTNGYQIAARYIGKYMSKGKYDCASVLDKDAQKPRVMQSIGVGKALVKELRSYCCAFDMYGEYDLNSFWCPDLNRKLNASEVASLVDVVSQRNTYCIAPDRNLPVPKVIKKEIFYERSKIDKAFYFPTTLQRMVSAYIRDKFETLRLQEFEKFLSENPSRAYNEIVALYERHQNAIAEAASDSSVENLRQFYRKSHF